MKTDARRLTTANSIRATRNIKCNGAQSKNLRTYGYSQRARMVQGTFSRGSAELFSIKSLNKAFFGAKCAPSPHREGFLMSVS